MNKTSEKNKRNQSEARKVDPQVELEGQFIMRLPTEAAASLRETLRAGVPLKDRLNIKLESDLRYGEVRFDHWLLHAKLVDLPTIVESLKTIDNKSFYKTADICQLLICKEEDDHTTDEESPIRPKKKDPNKVDKKFLWPHGITPPAKNIRRRRFRKTLRKKYVEAPEIEKEVKRLLRIDNDAVNVKWEVICEDEEQSKQANVIPPGDIKVEGESVNDTSLSHDVAEHDIFGGAVSDSEDEDEENRIINVMELDENSHLSVDSRVSDSNSIQVNYMDQSINIPSTSGVSLVTEFSKDMFASEETIEDIKPDIEELKIPKIEGYDEFEMTESFSDAHSAAIDRGIIQARREQLHDEINQLQEQRRQQESSIENIENIKLRERIQENINNFLAQEAQKMQELNELDLEDYSTIQ